MDHMGNHKVSPFKLGLKAAKETHPEAVHLYLLLFQHMSLARGNLGPFQSRSILTDESSYTLPGN